MDDICQLMLSYHGNGKSGITVCSVLTFVVEESESATLIVIHESIRPVWWLVTVIGGSNSISHLALAYGVDRPAQV